jgi:hypothetical protein
MPQQFQVGDHIRWNSWAGYVTGHIVKLRAADTPCKAHPRHCSPDDPQYEIKSDRTAHVAVHKGTALQKIA